MSTCFQSRPEQAELSVELSGGAGQAELSVQLIGAACFVGLKVKVQINQACRTHRGLSSPDRGHPVI